MPVKYQNIQTTPDNANPTKAHLIIISTGTNLTVKYRIAKTIKRTVNDIQI